MDGGRLLDELVVLAALQLAAVHNDEEEDVDTIVRAIQARLAETGIAQKHHSEECRFMLGEDRCSCSSAHWSWPCKGLTCT